MTKTPRGCFRCLIKSQEDRGSVPYGESLRSHTIGSLKPPVVAPNSLNLAISDTPVRANLDKLHNYHTNGDKFKSWTSSSFHNCCISVLVRTSVLLETVPPLGYGQWSLEKITDIHLGIDVCIKSVRTDTTITITKVRKFSGTPIPQRKKRSEFLRKL